MSTKIQVIIRKRPLSEKESLNGQSDIISVRTNTSIVVREPKVKLDLTKYIEEHTFQFDATLGDSMQNQNIYLSYVRPLLKHAFEGNKSTVFAFGQTGSGKTYTMNGNRKRNVEGIYEYASHDIFDTLKHPMFKNYRVSCTFYELYCEKIYDLLNERNQLKIGQDKKKVIHVTGGALALLTSSEDLLKCIKSGMELRKTSKNGTNSESSRSHAVLQISIYQQNRSFGQISFIDLAGCERGADTIDQGRQTKIDGAEINKSLLALKECIRAMDMSSKHIPFRGSKLTMILKDSFGDNCKTLMIGNVSPGNSSCQNTLNTLRYCDTVRELKQSKQMLSKEDLKAKELMLPRTHKNKVVISQMEQQPSGYPRLSLRNPNIKHVQYPQNNRNLRNTFSDVKKKQAPKQKPQAASIFSVRKIQSSSAEPLSFNDFEDWDDSINLLRKWDIHNEPLQPYQELITTIKNYLERQLKEYLALCQQNLQYQRQFNDQSIEVLRYLYSNLNLQNKEMYQRSQSLSHINQQKAQLLQNQQSKLQSYMTHLERQEQCERKMKQAIEVQQAQYAQEAHNQSHDDQMSMIDQIQSQWSEDLFCYEQPQIFNKVMTRQSLNLQKQHMGNNMSNNMNVMRSFEFRL